MSYAADPGVDYCNVLFVDAADRFHDALVVVRYPVAATYLRVVIKLLSVWLR